MVLLLILALMLLLALLVFVSGIAVGIVGGMCVLIMGVHISSCVGGVVTASIKIIT